MQKFTIFSIIFSLVVVLTIADVLFSGPSKDLPDSAVEAPLAPVEATEPPPAVEAVETDAPVELQEVTTFLPSVFSETLFTELGFEAPTIKGTPFGGLVFQLLALSPGNEAQISQWNLFSGASYVGTIYEIQYDTDTGGFQAYLNLRDTAKTLTDLGTVNEVNNYGDASFYFNHKTKVRTVHLLVRVGARLYGFEYSQDYHEGMKKVFDILKTLQ